jgi:hypothetical protein
MSVARNFKKWQGSAHIYFVGYIPEARIAFYAWFEQYNLRLYGLFASARVLKGERNDEF